MYQPVDGVASQEFMRNYRVEVYVRQEPRMEPLELIRHVIIASCLEVQVCIDDVFPHSRCLSRRCP